MNVFLKGEKVSLRPISPSDATENYLSWLHDPETNKGIATGNFPTTPEGLKNYIERINNDPNSLMFAVCDNQTEEHVGNIKLDRFDWVSQTCELGILIGNKAYWGKGCGEETCRLTLNYVFTTLNLRKVLLAVYENNPGAIKLYEKLGFQHEGRLRQHIYMRGNYYDKLFMGLMRNEFNNDAPN